ncbi:MAG: cadmium-translocating P-type ATPase [Acidobacteria bacterium]|nr:cadmium-translocating P-type ATPase [Acidobacteriota bacterium]
MLLALTCAGIASGAAVRLLGSEAFGALIWAITTVVVLVRLVTSVVRQLMRGEMGVDIIALLAMAGALALGQYLAGVVIALMLTGGQALETYAASKARRELSVLLQRAPRVVHRYESGALTSPDIGQVQVGDLLLVKPGEVVPVDGMVVGNVAVLDESTLTGESKPVERRAGERVQSGTLNAGGPFDLRAVATSKESTYAGIVRLVQEALVSKAPFVRLADRYALVFLPLTLAMAGIAWLISGDPIRVLAVLVVATPCPLILAAPVAIVSGISRAARRGILMKGGGALEMLARARILLLDKTGTLTLGIPTISDIEVFSQYGSNDLLRLAASLDQVSPHLFASAIVRAARDRGLRLSFPTEINERPGAGIKGLVDGQRIALGNGEWVSEGALLPAAARRVRRRTAMEGSSNVFVSIDGVMSGALILDNPIRPETPRTIRALRRAGIERVIVLTGDHPDLAEVVGTAIGADEALAERSPADKVETVRAERARGLTIMVGDGINDAPALAAADIGIAMGARGATVSSEAADVVLAVDRLDCLVDALRIARQARRIAVQSVLVGMSLSVGGMLFALGGRLAPVAGALLQEAIDVAVIMNALRALREGRAEKLKSASAVEKRDRVKAEHRTLLPKVKQLRMVADRLDMLPPEEARAELDNIKRFLEEELIPHEKAEDILIYPVVAELIGGEDPTGTMSRAHLEITHLTRLFVRLLEDLPPTGMASEDLRDLRRVLYGLDALLRLHFAQEEEHYLSLIDEHLTPRDISARK